MWVQHLPLVGYIQYKGEKEACFTFLPFFSFFALFALFARDDSKNLKIRFYIVSLRKVTTTSYFKEFLIVTSNNMLNLLVGIREAIA